MGMEADGGPADPIATVGDEVDKVEVSIGPQFLQLFSEHLYSSPNKAFEELVTNSWDAGATAAHVGMSDDLRADDAVVWVLDNGESMDIDGFRLLWSVASSLKPGRTDGRPQIGKFGIGKLSTYLLAHQLTYVCRSSDGVIRAVTMDYREIGARGAGLHVEAIPLAVREIAPDQLSALLAEVGDRDEICGLIADGVPAPTTESSDEFGLGDTGTDPEPEPGDTWTLVVMTDLKPAGRQMERGRIRRMLRTALPLGPSLSIVYCGEPLESTKIDVPVAHEWTIGPGLGLSSIELRGADGEDPEVLKVVEHADPTSITVAGIPGRITGTVRLYEQSISGGKSSQVAASNGFFVNILGRVLNPTDPYFGIENLNHSAWAKIRVAIRIDGLNGSISVDRESVSDERPVTIARGLLRAIFNMVRNRHDADEEASWPDAGEILTKRWGTVPLDPLRRVLSERMSEGQPPPFVVPSADLDEFDWATSSAEDLVAGVDLVEGEPSDPLVTYDPATRTVRVNANHPFAREHGATHEQQLALRDAGLVELLTQAYMSELGVADDNLEQIARYRDEMLRLVARVTRRTAYQLAQMLPEVTGNKDALEHAVSEALEHLGFAVHFISGSGEPEGVAAAPITPGPDGEAKAYTITFDAKSAKHGTVAAKDVNVAGLVRHRGQYKADHTLVVGPKFAEGVLASDCATHGVTPMRADDLAALLILQGTKGPIDLARFRSLFDVHDQDEVHEWVQALSKELDEEERLSYQGLFDALVAIGYQEPDTLTTAVIAREVRKQTGNSKFPRDADVGRVVDGLSILVPTLVRSNGSQVFLGTEPAMLRDAVLALIANVPDRYKFVAERVDQ